MSAFGFAAIVAPRDSGSCDYHTCKEDFMADQPTKGPFKGPLPLPTPETKHFWEGTRAGELRLQRCTACEKVYFPPRPFCPKCGSREVKVIKASGKGALVVELEEGPRMMTNIVGVPQAPEALKLDMKVKAVFAKMNDEISLVHFTPEAQ